MKIKLLDYKSEIHYADVGDIKEIGSIYIDVISGDEVLVVVYKDYTIKEFDSSNTRCEDLREGRYLIYNEQLGINFLKDKDFYDDLWIEINK